MGNPSHCRCGHVAEAHEHYRPGRDCGACGCRRFAATDARPAAAVAAVLPAVLFG
jgi:predicted  nucleic acid-binding Zn-ribbon protein